MWCLGCGTAGNDPYSCAQKAKTKQLSGPLVKSGNFGANSLGRAGGGAKNGANQKTAEGVKGEEGGGGRGIWDQTQILLPDQQTV